MPGRRRTTTAARARRPGGPRPPVPPAAVQPATQADQDLEPEAQFAALAFYDLDLTGRQATSVEFHQCRFRAATLAGSQLTRPRLTDCLVEACDWSNLHGEGGTAERVTVTGSRCTGLAWTDGLLRDVTFDGCKLDLTNWRASDFDAVEFIGCNLTRADFSGADLRGAVFTRCNLTAAQFSNATMEGTRVRGCELTGIGGVTSWQGAVVHPDDLLELSYALAGALGIVVDGSD